MIDATLEWYITLKKDYSKSLEFFHVINYIRHDYYNRGISKIHYISSRRISFDEIVDGKKKKVLYQILKTNEGILIKRQVSGIYGKKGINYLGPYKMELEFRNSPKFIILSTPRGEFILPKYIPNKEFILGISVK
ncbi:hypothetical protein [Thermosipho atlanticus]|nr:hypothetical protein [Thermosipho atlanticus]